MLRPTRRAGVPQPGEFIWSSVFSDDWRTGNQTIVLRLARWPSTAVLQDLAEFFGNLETTFVVLDRRLVELRWFAGRTEVSLCGHGALAASAALDAMLTRGTLTAVRNLRDTLWLSKEGDRPAIALRRARLTAPPARIDAGFPIVRAADAGRDYILGVDSEAALRAIDPHAAVLKALPKIGCIVTSPVAGATAAFRFFAPRAGIPEDRASGSVIPALVEYWAPGRDGRFRFLQLSGPPIAIDARKAGAIVTVVGRVYPVANGTLR